MAEFTFKNIVTAKKIVLESYTFMFERVVQIRNTQPEDSPVPALSNHPLWIKEKDGKETTIFFDSAADQQAASLQLDGTLIST